MRVYKPNRNNSSSQFCEHGQRNRRKQTAAERGVSERSAAVGTEHLSAGRAERDMDGFDVDTGPRRDRDAGAGAGEDGADGMRDERCGAADGWHDAGECDDCGGGKRFGSDCAELCERGGVDVERADGGSWVYDYAGGCECDDTVSDAVSLRAIGLVARVSPQKRELRSRTPQRPLESSRYGVL